MSTDSLSQKLFKKYNANFEFYKSKLTYPIIRISLIAIKVQKKLELWFESDFEKKFIKSYPILAASGNLGPKIKEGDKQVPEGIYSISYLNPNSKYYLSMKLNYPNNLDDYHAKINSRTDLGTDIFIHGKNTSIGCIAVGDDNMEEIYYSVSSIGYNKTRVIIMPTDFRKKAPIFDHHSAYEKAIYDAILVEIKDYIN